MTVLCARSAVLSPWRYGELAMINFLGCSAQGIAVANGVTTLALLEQFVERKILTRADVRAILGSGIECLEPRINVHWLRTQMIRRWPIRVCSGLSLELTTSRNV